MQTVIQTILRYSAAALVAALMSTSAYAALVHHVGVDTTSLQGSSGYLDLQFNPGTMAAPPARADVSAFFGNLTLLSGATLDGNTTGTLPGDITFINSQALNALLQPVTFGSGFSFDLSLSGDFLTATHGAGTRFSLALLDSNLNPLSTTDADGTVLQMELAPGGKVTSTTFDAGAGGVPSVVTVTPIPLPAALPLLLSALGMMVWGGRGRNSKRGGI